MGFEIAGKDHKYVSADAVIEGQSVVVSTDAVVEPVSVRYAWQGFTSAKTGSISPSAYQTSMYFSFS